MIGWLLIGMGIGGVVGVVVMSMLFVAKDADEGMRMHK